ncbi:hypothetical protein [Saccharothrix sp.]|uniref:hypothetical protein n=1 Tax=Saccharothrix sp. TaxID=1873460 RepID=UPI002810BAE8|nr:hypothetical protein [Saccharothrix sp.]
MSSSKPIAARLNNLLSCRIAAERTCAGKTSGFVDRPLDGFAALRQRREIARAAR